MDNTNNSKSSEGFRATITINPNDILINLLKVLEECSNSIFIGLSNLDSTIEQPNEFLDAEDGFHSYRVFGNNYPLETKKTIFKKWLLKKGFEDLVRAVTNALVSANVILDLRTELKKKENHSAIQDLIKLIKDPELSNNPTKRPFPKLLANVKNSLSTELSYENEIKSINNVRRCLVHRNGLVTKKDTGGDEGLILSWIAFQPIYTKDDTGEETLIMEPLMLEGPGQIGVKLVKRTRVFNLNDSILLDFKDFNELIWTVHLFGQDLISKFKI